MKMPHVLVTRRTIVLTRGNSFAMERLHHRPRQPASRPEEVTTEILWRIQDVLVVPQRCNQAIALNPCIVMMGDEREHPSVNQDDRSLGIC